MSTIHTHYDTLNVSRSAPLTVIKAAYRALSQYYHPDRCTLPEAGEIMARLNQAYAALSDVHSRLRHDEWIAMHEAAARRTTYSQSGACSGTSEDFGEGRAKHNSSSAQYGGLDINWRGTMKVVALAAVVFALGLWFGKPKRQEQPDEASIAATAVIPLAKNVPERLDSSESDYEQSLVTYPPMFPTRQPAVTPSVGTKRISDDSRPSKVHSFERSALNLSKGKNETNEDDIDKAGTDNSFAGALIMSSCDKPEYPAAAVRNEEEGTTTMSFLVDVRGNVLSAKIVRSSGYPSLDVLALTAIKKCKFIPLRRNGSSIRGSIPLAYIWTLG